MDAKQGADAAAGVEQRLLAVAEIGRLITLGLDQQTILQRAAEAAARLLDARDARFWLFDRSTNLLRSAAQAPAPSIGADAVRTLDASITGLTLQSGEPILLDRVSEHPLWLPVVDWPDPPRSAIYVPFFDEDRALGVLAIVSPADRTYGEADVRLVQALATQAGVAIQNARLYEASQRRAQEAMAVAEVGRAITASLDVQAVLELIVEQACRLLNSQRSAVALVENDGGDAIHRFVARRGMSNQFPDRMRPRHWLDGTTPMAIYEGRPIWSSDVLDDPALDLTPATRAAIEAEGYRAVLSVPLVTANGVLGALVVYRDQPGAFLEHEVELSRVFADQAAVALGNARLFEQAATVEALQEITRLKSEFLGTVSHELRTPLSMIHGYAELLRHRAPGLSPKDVVEMADEIYRNSSTMVRLVDDLLDFARFDNAEPTLQRRSIPLSAMLRRLVETFRRQPGGERIAAEVADGLKVSADPDRLSQVLSNLLANALRYAPNGPILVRATSYQDSICVEVVDEGPGVATDEQPRVWEKFHRGEAARRSGHRGSGLGLAVVKHLVELHGGRAGLKSVPGDGSTFWFTLPSGEEGQPERARREAAPLE